MDTFLEILIDNSSSMGYWEVEKEKKSYLLDDGSTRMELAKKILLDEVIPKLDYAKNVTIRKFHSQTYTDKTTKPIVDVIFKGELNKQTITTKINEVAIPHNTGGTPITAAIKISIDELAKFPNADRKIILVTDGEETDGGDYKKTAEEAIKQYGIPCNIFIVGIAQNEVAEEKSKALALSTGGSYINLKAKAYDKVNLQNALRPIYFKAVNTSIQNIGMEKPKPNPIITTPQPSIPQATPSNEAKLLIETEKPAETKYAEIIQNNSTALNLISKQLLSITEAIDSLKKSDDTEDEEVEITENAELNERIRIASESYLNSILKDKFGSRLNWLNATIESGQNHDFEVIDTLDSSIEYYIECKASMHSDKVFYMTKNEWQFFVENKSKYQVYFISNTLSNPQLTKIDNLMEHIINGQVVPFSTKNIRLKAERIVFTILK